MSQNIVSSGIQSIPPPPKKKKPPYRGVYYNRACAQFEAKVQEKSIRRYLGSYKLAADSALAVDEFYRSIESYNRMNFVSRDDYEKARVLEIEAVSISDNDTVMQNYGSVDDVLSKIQKQLSNDKKTTKSCKEEKKWNKSYNMLKEFKNQTGHCNVHQGLVYGGDEEQHVDFQTDNVKLSLWMSIQRAAYRKNELSAERIQLLNDIGFVWNAEREREIDARMMIDGGATLPSVSRDPSENNVLSTSTMDDSSHPKTDTRKSGPTAVTVRLPIEMSSQFKTAEVQQECGDKTNAYFCAGQVSNLQAKKEGRLKEEIKDKGDDFEERKSPSIELGQDNKPVQAEKTNRLAEETSRPEEEITGRSDAPNLTLEEKCKRQAVIIKQSEIDYEQLRQYVENYKVAAWQSTKHLKEIIQKMLRSGCEQSTPSFIWKEHSKEIMDASAKYGFHDLRSDAEAFYMINTNFTIDTVIDELLYAHSSNFLALKQASINFIVNHIDGVLESSSYDRLVLQSTELTKEIMRAVSQSSKKRHRV